MNTKPVFPTTAKLSIAVFAGMALSACGSGSDSPIPEPPKKPLAPEVNQAKTFSGPLQQAGEEGVSRFIRNGVYSSTLYGSGVF